MTVNKFVGPVFGNQDEPLALRLRKVQVAHDAAVRAGVSQRTDWPEYFAERLGDEFVSWQVAAYNPCKPHPCDPEHELPHGGETSWVPVELEKPWGYSE